MIITVISCLFVGGLPSDQLQPLAFIQTKFRPPNYCMDPWCTWSEIVRWPAFCCEYWLIFTCFYREIPKLPCQWYELASSLNRLRINAPGALFGLGSLTFVEKGIFKLNHTMTQFSVRSCHWVVFWCKYWSEFVVTLVFCTMIMDSVSSCCG